MPTCPASITPMGNGIASGETGKGALASLS